MKTLLLIILTLPCFAQMGVGTSSPHASSRLDIYDTAKGLLIPRLTMSQMLAIPSPTTGLMVFNSTTTSFWYMKTIWTEIPTAVDYVRMQIGNCTGTPPSNGVICIDTSTNKTKLYFSINNTWIKY